MSGTGRSSKDPVVGVPFAERAVLDALRCAVIATLPNGEIAMWNRAAEQLYGWSEAEVVGRHISEVLVPVHGRGLAEKIMSQVTAGEAWSGDFFVVSRDGGSLRVHVTDQPLHDATGRILGVVGMSEEVTDRRLAEHRAADLAERLALALDAGGLGTWRWDRATAVVEWDTKLEQLYGLRAGEFDGTFDAYVALLHPDDVATTLATVDEAVRTKSAYVVEHRVVWPDGSVHWLQGKGQVTLDDAGEVTGTIGCTADVTEQMSLVFEQERSHALAVAAAESERISRERLQFLAEINDALSRSNTELELMQNVTRTSVPTLGDWCTIFVLPESGGRMPAVEGAQIDTAVGTSAKGLHEQFPYDPDGTTGVPAVIRSGRSEFHPHIDEQVIRDADTTDEAREMARSLRIGSAMAVPLVKRGRILGAMQFVNTQASRAYTEADLTLAEATAARIAATLTNLRLTNQQRTIATTLQASLLPERLPEIEGLEIAVRYWAAGEATEVGGDFYDVFELDDGWAVVIGDVCGTGPEAASVTGLVRHTIRTLAWQNATHEDLLRQVNTAVLRSGRDTFCTALFATLTRIPTGFRFVMASGGHPLPLVQRAAGATEVIGRPGTLLGAFPDSRSFTVSTDLDAGDTMVLYTDGITDVPAPHDLEPDELARVVRRSASGAGSATEVVKRMGGELSAVLPISQRNDDIAILVLRVPAEGVMHD